MSKRQIKLLIIAMISIIIIVIGLALSIFLSELYGKNDEKNGTDVKITIPQGSSNKKIAKILKDNKLIISEYAFVLRSKRLGYSDKFKYGTFELNTGMKRDDLIKALTAIGKNENAVKFTIPEGYSLQEIAVKLEQEGLCTKDEFLDALENETYNYDFLNNISDGVDYKLQGFLFPATYEIDKDMSAKQIVEMMLNHFEEEFKEEYYTKAQKLGKSVNEIITIASMIEREAKLDEERATISGVIYNRINANMKLQIDATVQYAITEGLYNVNKIYNKDLQIDSKYNTYKYEGLPVGPICNPGIKSIQAALEPESHNYFYYRVIDQDLGKHKFTQTYEEHIAQ